MAIVGGLSQALAGLHIWKFTFKVSIQLKCLLILGSSDVYETSIHQRIAWQNVQVGSFTSNIERRSVGFSETDELRVVCNRLYFQGGNREFDKTICWCGRRRKAFGNDYNPSQQLWLDAGENRSHSLCTISVNVDCRDEFVVCYGVYAMSRELNFLTCGLEVLGSQTVSIVCGIIDGKSRALCPETAKSGFTDRRIRAKAIYPWFWFGS